MENTKTNLCLRGIWLQKLVTEINKIKKAIRVHSVKGRK